MSQEKVDKYKEEKANRKKNIAKEKRKKKLYTALGILLGVAFVAWISVSVFLEIKADREYESQQAELSKWYDEYMATYTNASTTSGSATTTTGAQATTGSNDETTSGDATTGTGETTSNNETTSSEETTSEEETTTSATE